VDGDQSAWVANALLIVELCDVAVRIGLSIRVIMRRLPVGVSLAWLAVVLSFPFFGAFIYLLIGELRLGSRRAEWAVTIHEPYQKWLNELRTRMSVEWETEDLAAQQLSQLVERSGGVPALPGNCLELLPDWEIVFKRLIADIDAAQRTCHLEFYIWNNGGHADEVRAALIRAARRGVICRVLLDDVGSHDFLRSPAAGELRAAGVRLAAALPSGLLRMAFVRFDLRMHRKIVVIDGRLAYTGSLNLVDPRYFKQEEGVGQWVDAMLRMEGPAVEPLAITFLEDWVLEAHESFESVRESGDVHPMRPRATAPVQVIPSGPAQPEQTMERILLSAIYLARKELVLTTPYFVPDESLVKALLSAAQRGVAVTLIVPARVDSRLVRLASQAYLGDLVHAGARVLMFEGGLLHTKSVTIDRRLSLFGSLNLDPRSLHLNFEITLAVFDAEFTADLRQLQADYEVASRYFDAVMWKRRRMSQRLLENAARLAGPLL
jgi:cardiolipin synthase A/B